MDQKIPLLAVALALSLSPLPGLAAEWTLVHAGAVLAVPGEEPLEARTVVVRDGRVVELREGFTEPGELDAEGSAVEVVDLRESFVLPGLIDLHTHITSELGPEQKLDRVTLSDVDVALRALQFLRRTLEAGFTTIRNTGGDPEVVFGLRDAIAEGTVTGPRIVAAGATISATGGHGDVHGFREEILDLYGDSSTCDGVADCRRAVRAQVKRGSDWIKITATGGVLSETAAGTGQQLFDDELEAIVRTAHSLGRKVAAHAHGTEGINAALRAGVDSIEHGTYGDSSSFALYRETGAYLVPTMLAGKTVVEMAETADFMAPPVREKALRVGRRMREMVGAAIEAGVPIAFGTDSGVSAHGNNAEELPLLVEAGMTPMEAIRSATVHAADLLDRSADLGTLEPGKRADLIAVDGNPLDEIEELLHVTLVMQDGVVHEGP